MYPHIARISAWRRLETLSLGYPNLELRWQAWRGRMDDPMETYSRALQTMQFVTDALSDEPDPNGRLALLIERIEGERAWVIAEMVLGRAPRRPPPWVRRDPALAR